MAEEGLGTSYEQLSDSILGLLETAATWIRQELEAAIRDKVAKPLIAAAAIGAVLSTALAAVVLTGIVLLSVGVTLWLGYAIGTAAAAVVVGTLILAACGLALYMTVKAVQQ